MPQDTVNRPVISDVATTPIMDTGMLELLQSWEVGQIQKEVERLIQFLLDKAKDVTPEPNTWLSRDRYSQMLKFDLEGGISSIIEFDADFKLDDGTTPYYVLVSIPIDHIVTHGDWAQFVKNLSDTPMHQDFARFITEKINNYDECAELSGIGADIEFMIENAEDISYERYTDERKHGFALTIMATSDDEESFLEDGTETVISDHGIYNNRDFPPSIIAQFPNLPFSPGDEQLSSAEGDQYMSSMDDLNNPVRAELIKILFQVLEKVCN